MIDTIYNEDCQSGYPRCRCTICASVISNSRISEKREKVPADLKYEDWKEKYVDKKDLSSGTTLSEKVLSEQRKVEIRVAESKAFYRNTDTDFGFNKIKRNIEWAKEIQLVNDVSLGLERRLNCQRCVVAFEARMRGYDVMARPSWGAEDPLRIAREWLSAFEYSPDDIRKANGKTVDEIIKSVEEIMRSFGEGSRAVIWFQWRNVRSGGGHVINARFANDEVIFLNPQNSLKNAKEFFKLANLESIGILRVDNLKFTDVVKRCCMNRE